MLKEMGVLSVLALLVMTSGGFALASPPVPPPQEGFVISTACDVEVAGDLLEEGGFTWTYVADTMDAGEQTVWTQVLGLPLSSAAPLFLAVEGRAAEVRYAEDLNAVDSSFCQFKKTFDARSHDVPNLEVNKDFGYVASEASLVAAAQDKETVGLGIVAYGDEGRWVTVGQEEVAPVAQGAGSDPGGGGSAAEDGVPQDMPSLCPWAGGEIPATNEFIAAGSSISTTSHMVSHTDSDVTSTGPPSLNHSIGAEGTGTASAQMKVRLMESDDSVGFTAQPVNGGWELDFVIPNLTSETVYDEKTTAAGVMDRFSKSMHYHSTVPQWQMPEPWYEIQ